MVGEQVPSRTGSLFSHAQNFVISGGEFNNIANVTQIAPLSRPDFPVIPLGEIDLQSELRPKAGRNAVVRRRNGQRSVRRMYSARVRGCQSKMTVAVYQGANAEREWLEDISRCKLARHPNIIQLFGTTTSSGLHAGIFHDELIAFTHLLENYRHSPVWTVYFWGFTEAEFSDAAHYINGLFGYGPPVDYILWIRPSTGRLCVDLAVHDDDGTPVQLNLLRGPTPRKPLLEPDQNSKIIEAMTPMWYHHICRMHLSRISEFAIPAQLAGPNTINCHFSSPESGSAVEISFKFVHPTIECGWVFRPQRAVMMKNGWTRLDSGAIWNLDVFRLGISLDEPRLCEAWLAQANYVFTYLNVTSNYEDYVLVTDIEYRLSIVRLTDDPIPPGYLFLCPLPELQPGTNQLEIPDCTAYWSPDPWGVERTTQAEAQEIGFPSFKIDIECMGYSWSASDYQGLRDFHQGKGFDPYSQDIARSLHLPLFGVPESFDVAGACDGEINNESVADTTFVDPEILTSRHGGIVLAVQFALIMTLTAFWLYEYTI